jgi:hypothetical protein
MVWGLDRALSTYFPMVRNYPYNPAAMELSIGSKFPRDGYETLRFIVEVIDFGGIARYWVSEGWRAIERFIHT